MPEDSYYCFTMKNEVKFFWFVIIVVILLGAVFLVYNENGYLKYRRVKNELDSLRVVKQTLQYENEILKNSIDSLEKKVPAKISRIARERYNMKGPNETAISVDE
jgi:cell division protein FtsB